MKKSVAFCLALALLFCLTALIPTRSSAADGILGAASSTQPASTPDLLTEAYTNLYTLDSMHLDMRMKLEMSMAISVSGQSLDIPVSIDLLYGMDQQRDPLRVHGEIEMNMNAMGNTQTQRMTLYGEQTGSQTTTFVSSDGGVTWNVSQAETTPVNPPDMVAILINNSNGFQTVKNETVLGREAVVYTGQLDGKFFRQLMEASGSGDALSGFMGEDASVADNLIGIIGVTLYIDAETHLPLRFSMDMTEMMTGMMKAAMEKAMGLSDMEGLEVSVDIPAVIVDCDLSQFNSVPPIEIPEAVRDAATASVPA